MNDADIEMAELEAFGNAAAAARAAGRCTHGSGQGFNPEFAPHLRPGQVQCRDCSVVFDSDEEWMDAMHEAVGY